MSTEPVEGLTNELVLLLPSQAQTVLFFPLKRRTGHVERNNSQIHTYTHSMNESLLKTFLSAKQMSAIDAECGC